MYSPPLCVLVRSWEGEWDDENLLARKRHTIPDTFRVLWVGVPVTNIDISKEDEPDVIEALERFGCVPVFLEREQSQLFYDVSCTRAVAALPGAPQPRSVLWSGCVQGYCKDTIWPVFHNVVDVYGKLPTRWWNRKEQEKVHCVAPSHLLGGHGRALML